MFWFDLIHYWWIINLSLLRLKYYTQIFIFFFLFVYYKTIWYPLQWFISITIRNFYIMN
jgi:hypothetical protein